MSIYRLATWTQWDRQEVGRIQALEEEKQTQAWIELSNLYLEVERGDTQLTIHIGNKLRLLVSKVYPDPKEAVLVEHWLDSFMGLEGWNDV